MIRSTAMAAALLMMLNNAAAADPVAHEVFGAAKDAATGAPESIGSYSKGCLIGGVQLAKDGAGWSAMRLERGRRWAHPEMVAFIERLAAQAPLLGFNGILVGDMGQARGGPMKSGHRSHQTGLDVDIWLRPLGDERPTAADRRGLSSHDLVAGRHTLREGLWQKSAAPMIRLAALDPAVARIFVNPAIKKRLCTEGIGSDRAWLSKVRAWWGHDAHFHVRLSCPVGSVDCVDQKAPPEGHGCDSEELDWWFTDEPYSSTSSSPREPMRLSDLPARCAEVVGAQ